MSTTASSRKGVWALLAFIGACAACCAVPLLGVIGFGTVTSVGLAAFMKSDLMIMIVIGSVIILTAVVVVARKRSRRAECTTACATDRSCCK